MERKRKFEMPHVIVVLLIIMTCVAILSYIVPSGQFERVYDETIGAHRTLYQSRTILIIT